MEDEDMMMAMQAVGWYCRGRHGTLTDAPAAGNVRLTYFVRDKRWMALNFFPL